jgi:hypothetical protein
MNKLLFLIALLPWFNQNNQSNGTVDDRITLLTGAGKKSWSLYALTPVATDCKPSQVVSSDNAYVFYADGTFEFDHGLITEDSSCDTCCTDFVNIIGQWKFTSNQGGLKVTILHERGNKGNASTRTLYDGTIDQLDEGVLKISQTEKQTNTRYSFEFRKK